MTSLGCDSKQVCSVFQETCAVWGQGRGEGAGQCSEGTGPRVRVQTRAREGTRPLRGTARRSVPVPPSGDTRPVPVLRPPALQLPACRAAEAAVALAQSLLPLRPRARCSLGGRQQARGRHFVARERISLLV